MCKRLVDDCEGLATERMTYAECESACLEQRSLLDEWTDAELRDAFDSELRCLRDETCAAIEAGACYDPELWAFSTSE